MDKTSGGVVKSHFNFRISHEVEWTKSKEWSESHSVVSDLYSPWNSLGQNTGVSSLSFLQGIFPTQGSNPGLLHCRQILYHLNQQGSPIKCVLLLLLLLSHFSRVRLFATPWIEARQASLSITNSQSSLRLKSIKSVMPSNHLILCHPLLLYLQSRLL